MNDTDNENSQLRWRNAADAPPQNRITQATFQASRQSGTLSPQERRRNRQAMRQSLFPPSWISDQWMISEPFVYSYGAKDSDESYCVRAGFRFDGASVPWLFTLAVPRSHSDLLAAAALHDYLYSQCHSYVPRDRADAIFREALQVLGLHWFWAAVMWRAVRIGGWVPWYARKPDTLPGRILALPFLLRWSVILPVMVGSFVTGVLGDCVSLLHYRSEGEDIGEADS